MGRACGTQIKIREIHRGFWLERLKEVVCTDDLQVYRRIILKRTVKT
jgi:hypothetical protein